MLQARVLVDLPSEEAERKKTLVDWFASVRGKDVDLSTGREELTLSCLTVVEAVSACMRRAEVVNAIALVVDDEALFVDDEGVDDDAKGLLEAARKASIDDAAFKTLQLVFESRFPGLHVLVDFSISRVVSAGRKEMSLTLAAQLDELFPNEDESVRDFAERLKIACRTDDLLENALKSLDRATNRIARELQAQFGLHSVQQGPAEALLVRPETVDFAALSQLGAESDIEPHYDPETGIAATHPDSYHRYYRDPLYALRNAVILGELRTSEAWQSEQLHIVDEAGTQLATGVTEQEEFEAATEGLPKISFDSDGRVEAPAG